MDSVGNIDYISAPEKDLCDLPITLTEVVESIKNVKVTKFPSLDSLTSKFCQKCVKYLAPLLLEVIYESIRLGSLPSTLRQKCNNSYPQD